MIVSYLNGDPFKMAVSSKFSFLLDGVRIPFKMGGFNSPKKINHLRRFAGIRILCLDKIDKYIHVKRQSLQMNTPQPNDM